MSAVSTQLENLFASGKSLSDAGLVHLKGLTELTKLDVSGGPVTDRGIWRI